MKNNIVFFPTNNLCVVEDFYTKVLELTIYHRTKNSVIFDTGHGCLGFVFYGDDRQLASGNCISFDLGSVEEVDNAYLKLKLSGKCDIKAAPQKHKNFPVYSFFFHDPNGYLLEYQHILIE